MNQPTKKYLIIGSIVLAVIAIGASIFWQQTVPGQYDAFARCIKDKGAIFYGAFWCPHCQTQKNIFGKSKKYLPYVECSTPDSKGQLKVCSDEKVEAYPTWHFADGSRETGELTFQQLSEKTGCQLPQ